ncbi:HNH endonuclease [Citricoccus alkalitolerans]|uniref:DUF222 domain-containing protein n=1 Tax=Citricoccus alkalitolerans TaxID=246603 RepID=A0ABV8XYD2_9MICC
MFESVRRESLPGDTSGHADIRPQVEMPRVHTLQDARSLIALRASLADMIPASLDISGPGASDHDSDAASTTSLSAPAAPYTARTLTPRFGPSDEDLAAVAREAEAITRIRALEDLKAACAAAQARETAALHQHRHREEAARGIPAPQRGRGLGSEIALARRVNQQRGSIQLRQALHFTGDLTNTLSALQCGQISEEHAATVERHTHWLTEQARRSVDSTLADRLPELGIRDLLLETQALAHRTDPEAAAERYDQAVATRHVNLKPTENGMAYLTALLPALEAAACYQALADRAGTEVAFGEAEGRSPQQVLTDVLVERLTGRSAGEASPVEVQLIMTDAALFAGDNEPAWIPGHGPLPAAIARKLLAGSATQGGSADSASGETSDGTSDGISHGASDGTPTPRGTRDIGITAGAPGAAGASSHAEAVEAVESAVSVESTEARVFLRRLYTSPETGQLVAMDSQRREFSGKLRRMIVLRDDTCRTPYCGAPIRHIDHATPHRQGGPTSFSNGSGLCARCNYTKEYPGWSHQASPNELEITTPTGHRYSSRARPLAAPPNTLVPDSSAPSDSSAPAITAGRRRGPMAPACAADLPVTVRIPISTPSLTVGWRSDLEGLKKSQEHITAVDHVRPRFRSGTQVEYAGAA